MLIFIIDNEDELHKLIVSTNGTIHDLSKKIFSADIIEEKNAGKIYKKVTENIRKSNKRQIEEKIANGPHILSNITITPNMHSSLSLPSPSQSLPRNLHPQSTSIFSNEANTTSSFSCSPIPYHKNQSSNNLQDTAHNTQTFTSIKEKTNVVHLNQEPNVYQNSTLNKYQDSASSSSQSFSHNQFSPINKSATTSSFSCSSSTLFHQEKSKRIYQNNTDSSSDSSSDSDSSSQNSRESEQNNVGKGIFLGLPNGISKH